MGLCAFLVDLALEVLNSWKFGTVKRTIASAGGFWAPYIAFLFFTVGFSCLSGCIVSFAAPLAAGSGIPEIKSYLNGVRVTGSFPKPCAVTKAPHTKNCMLLVSHSSNWETPVWNCIDNHVEQELS